MSRTLSRLGTSACVLIAAVSVDGTSAPRPSLAVVRSNANTTSAGVLDNGVLTVRLEAKQVLWRLNGPNRPPMTIEAFSEAGHDPLMPGPLIRAPQGTELHLSIRNSLRVPLTLALPPGLDGPTGTTSLDTLVVAPNALARITTRLTVPGSYAYRAATPTQASRVMQYAGLLTGALIVDSAGAPARPRDRVFVIMQTGDSAWVAFADTAPLNVAAANATGAGRFIYTINGHAWPATERIHASVGDSLHWRIINASREAHPMHLHGFYYRIDAFVSPVAARFGQPRPGQMVVTQLLSPFATMSMTWSPTRPGNWLFHCHVALHNTPDSLSAAPNDPEMRGMTGLVLGVEVSGRPGVTLAAAPASPARRLRLVAEGGRARPGQALTDSIPPMHFHLEDGSRIVQSVRDFSPELDLVQGEPIAITIVNHLGEPTTVHWHGIEVEDSYVDGVPGFSGAGRRLTPAIAPGDSFVVRFTPPRAGTFMYHAHDDDALQQGAGMEGALIVRGPADSSSADDHVFFLKGIAGSRDHPVEIDGQSVPDTVVLHVGRTARLRFLNLSTVNVAPIVDLTGNPDSSTTRPRDAMIVLWRSLAKDGYDMPAASQVLVPARQNIAIGETYDFGYTPRAPGMLHLEFRTNGPGHRLLIQVPIRVE